MWHILDTGSIWMKEFASALGELVPVKCWVPVIRNFGWWEDWTEESTLQDPPLKMTRFPLQRGYARYPISRVLSFADRVVKRLLDDGDRGGTLICTSPFYAPVAELWPGPVVYYLTDKTAAYEGMDPVQIRGLDVRMCRVASLVAPNSERTGVYLHEEASCPTEKIVVIPNATRARNVLDQPIFAAAEAPQDLADLPRPIVGVIGNLSGNMDWELIRDAVTKSKGVSWAFVGPVTMKIPDPKQRAARADVMSRGGRVRFIGPKPYGDLCLYSRAFDCAFLPYYAKEPMLSASPTRFYEHLAACRPILASPGAEQLLDKEPLLRLVTNGDQVAAELRRLSDIGFRDGQERARWQASHQGTWQVRAADMLAASGLPVLI